MNKQVLKPILLCAYRNYAHKTRETKPTVLAPKVSVTFRTLSYADSFYSKNCAKGLLFAL